MYVQIFVKMLNKWFHQIKKGFSLQFIIMTECSGRPIYMFVDSLKSQMAQGHEVCYRKSFTFVLVISDITDHYP